MPPTSDSKLTDRGGRKAHDPRERKRRSDRSQQKDGVNKHSRPGERKRSPGADPSDDPSTRKRDEWKASTRTEGDSTGNLPQARLHALAERPEARDKHTGDVETTPCSARGEEDRSKQAPGKRPEERMGLPRLNHPNPRTPERRQDTLKKTARGKHPEGRTSAEPRPRTMERQRLQSKKAREKWEASPQAAALATHKGSSQPSGNQGGRTPKGEQPPRPLRAKSHSNIRDAAVPEETRQVQDELNRRPANAATLNLNEGKKSSKARA